MKNGWGGRWWYLLLTFFREGLRYFQGGVVEKLSRGSHVGNPPPPPPPIFLFFENRRGTKKRKTDGGEGDTC